MAFTTTLGRGTMPLLLVDDTMHGVWRPQQMEIARSTLAFLPLKWKWWGVVGQAIYIYKQINFLGDPGENRRKIRMDLPPRRECPCGPLALDERLRQPLGERLGEHLGERHASCCGERNGGRHAEGNGTAAGHRPMGGGTGARCLGVVILAFPKCSWKVWAILGWWICIWRVFRSNDLNFLGNTGPAKKKGYTTCGVWWQQWFWDPEDTWGSTHNVGHLLEHWFQERFTGFTEYSKPHDIRCLDVLKLYCHGVDYIT